MELTDLFSILASKEYFLIKIRPPLISPIERLGLSLKEKKERIIIHVHVTVQIKIILEVSVQP